MVAREDNDDNDDDHDDHNQCIREKGGRHRHAAPPNPLWNTKFQIKIIDKTKKRQQQQESR